MSLLQPDPSKPSILANVEQHVAAEVAQLAADEKAKVAVSSDQDTLVRAGGAVDLGKGFSAGGHVEKTRSAGWGWFAGVTKRWKKK